MSVILKERKGTDSVTLAWQGPEPADGTVVEYEVTYYEKVRGFGLSLTHSNLHDLLALCEFFLHWLDIWQLTFIVPWGEAVMLTQTCFIRSQLTFIDVPSAKNLQGCHILELMTLLSWTNHLGFVQTGSQNPFFFFTVSNSNLFRFVVWTAKKHMESYIFTNTNAIMFEIESKSHPDVVWNPIKNLILNGEIWLNWVFFVIWDVIIM